MDLTKVCEAYAQATSKFLELAQELSDEQLDKKSAEGWTARQVIHHMADSEAQSYARLRRLIAEPGTEIQGYDERIWGENQTLGYSELPVAHALEVVKAVRTSSLVIIRRLREDQVRNSGVHSQSGTYTIEDWLTTYINHPLEHAAQINSGL